MSVPDFTISASPASLTLPQGSTGGSNITTTPVNSVGTVVLTTSAPAGVLASLSSTSFPAGQGSALTVVVDPSTVPGSYFITVTGTEGSRTHSTNIALTVPDFTLSASPSSLKVPLGSSATATIATSSLYGPSALWLTVSGAPDGTSATLDTTGVAAGQSATLTIDVGASTASGPYTITVTGAAGSTVHTTTVTLTVPEPIANPGFELGTLNGWTRSGTTSISTTPHHGSYSAEIGASGPTNGTSTLVQSFTLPAATTTLSFWYDITCPGSVSLDWAHARLQDEVTGAIVVLLPKTCTLGQGGSKRARTSPRWRATRSR